MIKVLRGPLCLASLIQKLSLVIMAMMFASAPLIAAPDNVCNSVEFTTQAQVNAFDQGCTVIDGQLTIRGDDIQNLTALSNVEQVDALKVFLTTKLANLSGLDALQTVTQCILFQENENLTSLTGLEKLSRIGGEPNEGTGCLGLGLFVHWNPQLRDLDGLKVLSSITGDLSIWNNDNLLYLRGLAALDEVTLGYLDIRGNDFLRHLDGLEGLVGADKLFIDYNVRLLHVDGLKNLRQTFVTPSAGRKFEVTENWQLARCEGLAPFFSWPGREYLRDVSWFEDNESGCESLDELWASVVVTEPVVRSVAAANGRMSLEFDPATVNTGLFPLRGHHFGCYASEDGATQITSPLRTVTNGSSITERHYFSSDIREPRRGQLSQSYAVWTPVFNIWHPSPSDLTVTMDIPSGDEILLFDRFNVDPGVDNRLVFPDEVWTLIQGTRDEDRIFPGAMRFREVEQELQGWYEITLTDSIATQNYGRLNSWGVMALTELFPYERPVQGNQVVLDSVLNELEYQCYLEPEFTPLSSGGRYAAFTFTSDLSEPQSAPHIINATPQADAEASILVEFSQPWAWHAELQDYLVTCEADGEEPAYGYALAENGDANQVMAADGRVTQAILVEGVSEEVEYSCSVTGYNRRGGGTASAGANVTKEAVIRGLPIWLLYEATRAP